MNPERARTTLIGPVSIPGDRRRELVVLGCTAMAAAFLALPNFVQPRLLGDDFAILPESRDFATTIQNLWVPHNEHAMPLGRIAIWALVQIDANVDTLALRCAFQGPLAIALATLLTYLFVRREWQQPLPALLASALFGVSLRYLEVLVWYSASFWLLGFDTMLLALLAAQRWRRSGRNIDLALCVSFCALAPGWYAGGVLAGPFCVLYLLPRSGDSETKGVGRVRSLLPILGTLLFLAASLPQNASQIMHARHYQGRTAWEAFDPIFGLICTGRAIVDVLFVFTKPIGLSTCPPRLVPVLLAMMTGIAAWWNRRASRRIILLAVGMILGHYLLTFSPRGGWLYDPDMLQWTRYHLVPWFGMVLLIVNGLAARNSRAETPVLGRRRAWQIGMLVVLLFTSQVVSLAIGWSREFKVFAIQQSLLARVAEVDRRCQRYRISAADARAVLEPVEVPMSGGLNGWDWLRGSDQPVEHSPEEVRKLLGAE
jgi:hypothetical protein